MVLIKHFHSTNIWNAFILNSIASSLVIVFALTVKDFLNLYTNINPDKINDKDNNMKMKVKITWYNILIIFIVTFFISMIAYTLMYFIFGFGGGMLAPNT